MTLINRPVRQQQPVIPLTLNRGNSIIRGLTGAWVPLGNTGNLVGTTRLYVPTLLVPTGFGVAGRFAGQIGTDSTLNTADFSFALALKTGTATSQSAVLGRGVGNGELGFHATHVDSAYAGAIYCGSGYTIIGKPAGAALADNTRYVIGAGASGSNGTVYLNGRPTASSSSLGAAGTGSGTGLYFGQQSTSGDTWTTAPGFEYFFFWNRKLTDAEFLEIANNPWQIFVSNPRRIFTSVISGGSTGTSNTTNNNDTLAASGTTTVVGTLSKTNNNDTLSASGTTTVTGTLSKTNNNDTLSAAGTVGAVTGTASITEQADTLAASGTTTIVGTLSKTNNNDTSNASGTTTVLGTSSTTNNNDTLSANGVVGTPPSVTTYLPLTGVGH